MGVTGLWKLIEPCGKPVPVETLEGKILAVDISIWLHQVVKGFQDSKGSALPNAHLLGLFHRLCKLLYYRVRPVFVFDGCVPQLKRDTIARRQQQRSKLNSEAERIQLLLLQSLANEKVVQQALGPNAAEMLLKSPSKRPSKQAQQEKDKDDLFKLPELPSGSAVREQSANSTMDESSEVDSSFSQSYSSEADSSMDDASPWYAYNANLQAIDVRSKHFRNLPAEVRHDILVDIKETRKQSSWGRLHELPSRSDDFSDFQMKRLLKRRAVQESLEEAEKEMGGVALTYNELKDLFTEEGIIEPAKVEKSSSRIHSDENTRFLLVRDLKKKLAESEVPTDSKISNSQLTSEEVISSSSSQSSVKPELEAIKEETAADELGCEYDQDLALAIALSLEEPNKVYSNEDYEYDGSKALHLNKEQRKQLKDAAVGPARAYMIEYGGMNEDEVVGIMEKTQALDEEDEIAKLLKNESKLDFSADQKTAESKNDKDTSSDHPHDFGVHEDEEEIHLRVSDASDTDSDLEVVPDESSTEKAKTAASQTDEKRMEIVLDTQKPLALEDDIFADIFEIDKNQSDPEALSKNQASAKIDKQTIEITESKEVEKTGLEVVLDTPEVLTSEDSMFLNILKSESSEFKQKALKEKKSSEDPVNDSKPQTVGKSTDGNHTNDDTNNKNTEDVLPETVASNLASSEDTKLDSKMSSILNELKKQAQNVATINLNDVKVPEVATIEISDDDANVKSLKTEFIEIYDSDDADKETRKSSPVMKTPSKRASITDFFDSNYKIVRTPTKTPEEPVPKVKSPFFVKKSPRSAQKRSASSGKNSPSPEKKLSTAAKTLFESSSHADTITKEPAPSAEATIQAAARVLQEKKSTEELQALASDLTKQRLELESERNRQDRMGMSISQRMSSDCQQLLRLFGIPYIVAPMEAEAQCAFLDAVELTHGTITDDSDIWLFGGRTVYKNFFEQNKHVLEYRAERIEQTFKCDRKKLIQLACLVGSDYTAGVHGIGAVTALEILASFSAARETETSNDHEQNIIAAALSTLRRFRDWWHLQKNAVTPPTNVVRLNLRKKLKNIELQEGFPNSAVIEAYLKPQVDESKEPFKWGYPDVESIREYARKTFGWTTKKTDDILTPVMKRLNEKRTQASIKNYFTTKSALAIKEPKVSKRVQKAIDTIAGRISDDVEEKAKKAPKKRATKRKKLAEAPIEQTEEITEVHNELADEPSTSSAAAEKRTRRVRIPETKQVIPQRERDLKEMEENKAKAAEILKRTSGKKTNKKRMSN